MSETQINELKRDLKYKGEIIKSLTESNNNLIVNQQITALAQEHLYLFSGCLTTDKEIV